jgi:hypothetical protein
MKPMRTSIPLSPKATAYLAAVMLAAVAATAVALTGFGTGTERWKTYIVLAAGAAIAQVFVIEIGRNHGFPVALVFVVAGALLLPVQLVALLGLSQHAPDIVRRRFPWYIQSFNVGNYTLDALAAWAAVRVFSDHVVSHGRLGSACAGLVAAGVFVALNHLLLGTMLRLARGHSLRASRLFTPESLSIDLVLAALGVALAAFANSNPTLAVTAVAPLLLVHRLLRLAAAVERHQISTT